MLFLPLTSPRPFYPTKLHVLSLYIEKNEKKTNKRSIRLKINTITKQKAPLLNTNPLQKKSPFCVVKLRLCIGPALGDG